MESLENRLLLTVSTDAGGWTVVTPSSTSRLIYVSSSTGSDANSGLSPDAPLGTLSAAYALLRNGSPDWILFKRGDTFTGNFNYFGDSGKSAQEPMVLTSYGDPTLPRPVIDSGANVALRTGTYNHDIYILGLAFTSSTHNPNSPNYNGQGNYGLYDLGNTWNMLIEDCSFSYFTNDVSFTAYNGALGNITLRRSQILDSYATSGHSQGFYADGVTNLTITENVFDHDGWNADVPGAGATIYNHDCYLHSSDVNCVVTGNIFANAGSFGLQARAGGVVDNNFFVGNPFGFSFGLVNGATTTAGGVSGEAVGNVVIEPRADNAGWGIGAMIGNLKPGGGTTISNNIFAAEHNGTQPAIIFQPGVAVSNPQDEVGLNTLVVSHNTVYDWGFGLQLSEQFVAGTTGSTGLKAVVIRDNNFQNNVTGRIVNHGNQYDPRFEDWSGNIYASSSTPQSNWFTLQKVATSLAAWQANIEPTAVAAVTPFVDPDRTIEKYMTSQGLLAAQSAFVAGADAQNKQNWNPVYFARTVNSYIQGGYLIDSSAPAAAATPPPDVTPDNYQSSPSPAFTVTFTDAVAIDPTTITSASVAIAGAGGFSLPVSLVSVSGSGSSVTATYQVSAPGGDWTTVPNGTYVISLVGAQVKNSSGQAAPAAPLASFQATVNPDANPTSAAATTPVGLTAVAGASSIALSWSDPAADQRSFLLQRALDAGFTQGAVSIPLAADATSYVDASAAVGTPYYYQIIAVNPNGPSAPTAPVSATVLPPAPALSRFIVNDGNASRTAVTSVTLVFTQPVNVDPSDVSLVQDPAGAATPTAAALANPTGDGKSWVVSWNTGAFNNRLPDGAYALTVHGGLVADAFGQTAGGDRTTTFNSVDAPVVTAATRVSNAPPHSISLTFSQDVSASLSLTSLVLGNAQSQAVPAASYAWNASTLTATWTYSGALPDGNYSAQLAASAVSNALGTHLDGNKDGIPGDSFTYNFTQVKPTLSISGASNVNVNAPYTLTLGAITDAGQTSPSYVINWGDGTSTAAAAAGKITHTYSVASGPTTISVDVVDANGTHANCASTAVSVNRATIALAGNANANPNAAYTLTLGTVTDPGYAVSSYIVHWGDGASNTYSATGNVTHVYANATSSGIARKITVDLVDNSGAGGASFTNLVAATLPITVNAYPYVPVNGVLNANIGGTYNLFFGTINDPGFTVSQLTVNWGDGTAPVSLAPGAKQLSHVFAPGAPSSDTIRVTLTDNSGAYSNAGVLTITVNPSPTVSLTGSATANAGGTYALTVNPANDPGQTVSQYTIHWGDGTSTATPAPGLFTHVYAAAANALISVDVADGTGVFPAAGTLPVTVNNAPTVSLSGNANANAGGVYTLNLAGVNDPGQTVSQYLIHWGDGQTSSATSLGPVAHTYAGPGPQVISVDLTDGAGTYTAAGTLAITVARPTVSLGGNAGVFQGQNYSLTINPANDPGGTPAQYIVHWGDGTSSAYASAGAATHAYAAAQQTIITVDLVDDTGTFIGAGSMPVTVAAPPTLSLAGASSVSVGAPYTLTVGAASDALGAVSSYIIHWGDNSSDALSAPGPVNHVYGAEGPQSIVVDVVDPNGVYANAASLALTVGARPTVALSGNANANANGVYTLTLGAVTDANGTPGSYLIHWGDGSTTAAASVGDFPHVYAAPGTANITVDLTDPAGAWTGAGALPITVNPAPTVALSGNANANATGVYALTLGTASDPGYAVSQYTVHWGDGQVSAYSAAGVVTHTYSSPGSAAISVDLTDSTGTFANAGALAVTVNPPPTVALGGATSVAAGTAYSLTVGPVSDPGYTPSQYTIHWGDGTTSAPTAAGVVSHTYISAGSATISVDLTDATGVYAAVATKAVTVAPATATLAISGNANANAGGTYTLNLGAVNDPGATVQQYVVHWGDGQSSSYTTAGAKTHVYATPGSAVISVDLSDSKPATYLNVASMNVAVNPPPTIALGGSATATKGVAYALNLGAVSDPGYAVSKYTVYWGDGSTSAYTAAGNVTHTYSATGNMNITVALTDATGTYNNAAALPISVAAPASTNIFTNTMDIGAVPVAGSASFSNGVYTVKGSGKDIYNTSDQFRFDYKNVGGSATIIARVGSVTNTSSWAKAGVMIRNGTAANAAFADVVCTPGGYLSFQYRSVAGGSASNYTVGSKTVPQWVKLVRSGNTFTAYYSSNGSTWTKIGASRTISMNTTAAVGLAVTSLTKTLNTATFTNVSVTTP